MPDSFLDKLNTLVKAHINNILDPIDEDSSKSRKKALSRQDIRGGLQKDVKILRQRIDAAIEYENIMQAKIDKLYAELRDWDTKADKAVADGRENDARFALGRIQQAQREIEMLEADLREHRTVTQELISQVNMLDSTIASSPEESTSAASNPEPSTEDLGAKIIQSLESTRQNLNNLISDYTAKVTGEAEAAKSTPVVDEEPDPNRNTIKHPVDKSKVNDDYEARLSRLSKPDDKK